MIPELTQSSILRKAIGFMLIISFTLLFGYKDLLAAEHTSKGVKPTATKQLLEIERSIELGVDFTSKSAFNLCMLVGIGSYQPVHTDLIPLSGYLTLRVGYQL